MRGTSDEVDIVPRKRKTDPNQQLRGVTGGQRFDIYSAHTITRQEDSIFQENKGGKLSQRRELTMQA